MNRRFQGSASSSVPLFIFERLLPAIKADMQKGMNSGATLNDLDARQMAITGGAYFLTREQLSIVISTLYDTAKGNPPGDPNEAPSWSEAYAMSPLAQVPWGTLALAAGGIMLAYGFAVGAGKGLFSR